MRARILPGFTLVGDDDRVIDIELGELFGQHVVLFDALDRSQTDAIQGRND